MCLAQFGTEVVFYGVSCVIPAMNPSVKMDLWKNFISWLFSNCFFTGVSFMSV